LTSQERLRFLQLRLLSLKSISTLPSNFPPVTFYVTDSNVAVLDKRREHILVGAKHLQENK
jgi:hypothetical protein